MPSGSLSSSGYGSSTSTASSAPASSTINIGSARFPRGLQPPAPVPQGGSPSKPGIEGTRVIKKMPPPPAAPSTRK
ncbi:hypothetical protein HK097_005602 [Rhizophlyctis rosea]|uniref:Uncharacterized protein n=1 Tax=Rhizophlyctis rosea TaxID=64517 RepID=A0AAD5WW68_9FUNG|nr:hypothetical protein HK097_005602 [Rhizophlyctis rosea]